MSYWIWCILYIYGICNRWSRFNLNNGDHINIVFMIILPNIYLASSKFFPLFLIWYFSHLSCSLWENLISTYRNYKTFKFWGLLHIKRIIFGSQESCSILHMLLAFLYNITSTEQYKSFKFAFCLTIALKRFEPLYSLPYTAKIYF